MAPNEHNERAFADFWDDADDEHASWLANKRDDVAITLTGMLHAKGMSFAELAEKLGWKRSRVSKALSGRENLTTNTIAEIVKAAGFDFDIAVRKPSEVRHFQPWEQNYTFPAKEDSCANIHHKNIFPEAITKAVQAAIEEAVNQMAVRSSWRRNYTLCTVAANDGAVDEFSEAA